MMETKDLTPQTWPAFEALLGACGGCDGCWCYNHHIPPGHDDVRGEPARIAFRDLVHSGKAHGIVAFEQGEPAGWCAVDPRVDIPGHDCALPFAPTDRNAVWSVHCFYVRPKSRGQGLTHMLLAHAQNLVRRRGGLLLEAYPTPPGGVAPVFDFCGAYSIYEKAGFEATEDVSASYARVVKQL